MQLSGGPYTYNRFDAFEEAIAPEKKAKYDKETQKKLNDREKKPNPVTGVYEGKDASTPEKMKKKVDKASRKAKTRGVYLEKEDEKEEGKEEVATAEGGNGGGMSESFFIEDEDGNIYEGKKDACYHKVKSRYSVWPSAYASGALVKCRKKGAANWGNSSKKEMYDDFGHEYVLSEEHPIQ